VVTDRFRRARDEQDHGDRVLSPALAPSTLLVITIEASCTTSRACCHQSSNLHQLARPARQIYLPSALADENTPLITGTAMCLPAFFLKDRLPPLLSYEEYKEHSLHFSRGRPFAKLT
jgi:hypothetical protein